MPRFLDRIIASGAMWHARRVFARFQRALHDVDAVQSDVLARVLHGMQGSGFARQHGLERVRTLDDLRRAVPLRTYEDLRPFVDRVRDGDAQALFAPGRSILMFATSSGTTAQPKYIPVTQEFVNEYRRGWNAFGLKMLSDHPRAILRAILQSSGRYNESYTTAGIPCGAITGLLARTQKGIVRRYYVGKPEIAEIDDPRGRYYALARFGIVRDVAFAVTANPATLIRIAQVADEESERLIRDVHDGVISAELVGDAGLVSRLLPYLKRDAGRARELDALRTRCGALRPRDYWRLEFLACWTGGSMGHYLQRVADWYGSLPVRDVGLLASEGRVSVPLADATPTGVLDVPGAVFEFIPLEQSEAASPATLTATELAAGHQYVVVLTNHAGLVRYRLDDVVRVVGRVGQAPVVEFLHRAGGVSSVAGEKLTENQVVEAVRLACNVSQIREFDFVAAPVWGDPPFYRLSVARTSHPNLTGDVKPVDTRELAQAVDTALNAQNEEYASRRKSLRIGMLQVRFVPQDALLAMDRRLLASRNSNAEQFKRPCLFTTPGDDDQALSSAPTT